MLWVERAEGMQKPQSVTGQCELRETGSSVGLKCIHMCGVWQLQMTLLKHAKSIDCTTKKSGFGLGSVDN